LGSSSSQAFTTLYNNTLSYIEAMLSGDGMTNSPVNLFTSARDLAGRFVQAFSLLSPSMQDKAINTVCYRVKALKMTRGSRLLILKTKMVESKNQ
jgi:hypothetical protein